MSVSMKSIQFLFSVVLVSSFIPAVSFSANASFYLSPETGVYTIGDEFPVAVMLNTDGVNITAAGGKLEFNNKELRVLSISKEESLFTSWIGLDDEFKIEVVNDDGVIPFEGFISGGYEGDRGHIMVVNFEALSDIASKVKFQTGSAILAADSVATNILTEMNSGVYTLNAAAVTPSLEYVAAANTDTSVIVSSLHPDQEKWYRATTTTFSWELADDVQNVRMLFDAHSNSIPTRFYEIPISEKTIEDIEEGVWYFHLQTKNEIGWGEVSHYTVRVDTTSPEYFTVEEQERQDLSDPKPVFLFDSFDAFSGIQGYELYLDGEVYEIVQPNASSTQTLHQLKIVTAGDHVLRVRVIDKAGNNIEQTISFSVEAIPAPKIVEYKKEVTEGGVVVLKGQTLPDSEVKVFVSKNFSEPVSFRVLSDAKGDFVYIMGENVSVGEYEFWAQAKNVYGAESEISSKTMINVVKPGIEVYGGVVLGYLSIIVPLVGLAVLLFVFLWFGWYKFRVYKKRLHKEVDEAESTLHTEFAQLKKITERELGSLENARSYRQLTSEEESILHSLKKGVSEAEQTVGKEFEDIKKVSKQQSGKEEVQVEIEQTDNKPQPSTNKSNKMQLKIEKLH